MNLAVIIGVANYNQPGSDLPACNNDVKLIKALLLHTGKYQEIVDISNDTTSSNVKGTLANFVKKHQGAGIDELFFYYTGHGGLFNDGFHFLLTDYDEHKKEATSLSNNELDQMLRSLSPSLTVKLVDACHAGVTYVKDPEALAKHLEHSKRGFSNCYFMFSSQPNQSSYQDSRLSVFTEAFIDACLSFPGSDIRFKDIIDSIVDSFSDNGSQQPFFVTQCTFTEIFFRIDQTIKDALTSMAASYKQRSLPGAAVSPGSDSAPEKTREDSGEPSLLALVESQAQQYCTNEEFLRYLSLLEKEFESAQFSGELEGLYDLLSEFHRTDSGDFFISNRKSLGKWLKDNQGDFFARPTYYAETYEEEVPDYEDNSLVRLTTGIRRTKKVIKSRQVLFGFDLTAEAPYQEARIIARPRFQNIPYIVCVFTFVFSKKEIVLFFCIHEVAESDWGKLAKIEEPKWRYITSIIREDLDGKTTSRILLSKLQEFAEHAVRKKVGLAKDEPVASKPEKGNAK